MKMLKVTWLDGSWNRDESMADVSALVSAQVKITLLGETLVFQDPTEGEVVLLIPDGRLVSAVLVDEAEAADA